MRTLKDFTVIDYGDFELGRMYVEINGTGKVLDENTMLSKREFKESAFQDIKKYRKITKNIEKNECKNHGPIYWITVGHIEYIKKKFNITEENIKEHFKTGDKNDKN